MADDKKHLRSILKECRLALARDLAGVLSRQIERRLLDHRCYHEAACVVLYSPIDNEVLTDEILVGALGSGRTVYFPRVNRTHREIDLIAIDDKMVLKPGAFGISEPPNGDTTAPELLPKALVCVPGLAFSMHGQRLGRGGGYYDRLISRLGSGTTVVGLAYSFQLLDSLPERSEDQRMHYVATESAIHGFTDPGDIYADMQKEVYPGGTLDRAPGNYHRKRGHAGRDPDPASK